MLEVATLVVAVAVGPATMVWQHGPTGQRGALVLLATAIGTAAGLAGTGALGRRYLLALPAAVVATGAAAAVPLVGRAPVVVTALLVVGGHLAAWEPSVLLRPPPGRLAATLVLLAALAWRATSSLAVASVAVAVAVAVGACTGRTRLRHLEEAWAGAASAARARWAAEASASVRRASAAARSVWRSGPEERVLQFLRAAVATEPHRSVAVAVVAAVGSAPIYWRLIGDGQARLYGYNDHREHLAQAADFGWVPFHLSAPHPVLHILTSLGRPLLGTAAAMTLVVSLALGATAAIVYRWVRQPSTAGPGVGALWAAALAISLMVAETPVAALNAFNLLDPPRPFFGIHPFASPTDSLALPLTLLLLELVARPDSLAGDRWWSPTPSRLAIAGTTTVLTLAKPAAALAMVPAIGLYLLISRRRSLVLSWTAFVWCASWAAAVLAWQGWFIRNSALSEVMGYTEYRIVLDPLHYVAALGFGPSGPWFFWWSLAPVVLASLGGRTFLASDRVRLALCALPGTLAIALLAREDGVPVEGQDLLRPLVYAVLPLVYLCSVHLAQQLAAVRSVAERRGGQHAIVVATVVLAVLWFGAGVVFYVDAIGAWPLEPTTPSYWPPP